MTALSIDSGRAGDHEMACGGNCAACTRGTSQMTEPMLRALPDAGTALSIVLNLGTLANLPDWSAAPKGDSAAIAAGVRSAGYAGVQGSDDPAFRAAGLTTYASGRVVLPHEAASLIESHQAQGHKATTLHVGTGLENDNEAMRLIEAVLQAAERLAHPTFIETHRATITQDIWRTLRWIEHFPELRFNADLSHWYTGLEMPYGDFEGKLSLLAPFFARVGFIHGRIGNGGAMQVAIGIGGRDEPHVSRFAEMWRRCFAGYLARREPGGPIVFAPELLPAQVDGATGPLYIDYALTQLLPSGKIEETSDRWEQALKLVEIAKTSFADAYLQAAARRA
jgi:hypothetical protein